MHEGRTAVLNGASGLATDGRHNAQRGGRTPWR
jgi:hypothetical protein